VEAGLLRGGGRSFEGEPVGSSDVLGRGGGSSCAKVFIARGNYDEGL